MLPPAAAAGAAAPAGAAPPSAAGAPFTQIGREGAATSSAAASWLFVRAAEPAGRGHA